jgi:phage tail-like protein
MTDPALADPLHVFRFHVAFQEQRLQGVNQPIANLCSGAFSQCSGLEASMEAKVIKEGGRNYGAVQRVGPVSFATVVLKRGITSSRDLWRWFEMTTVQGAYSYRLNATISLRDRDNSEPWRWQLSHALPIKFKSADLDARSSEVGIEELHISHQGLTLLPRS